MPGLKKLRSIPNSIAHHALSGLGESPERTLEQRRAGTESIDVDLMDASDRDFAALRDKFAEILEKESVDASTLQSANATFLFRGQCRTADSCIVLVRTHDGREFSGSAGKGTLELGG